MIILLIIGGISQVVKLKSLRDKHLGRDSFKFGMINAGIKNNLKSNLK
jgi:hypothetical protein